MQVEDFAVKYAQLTKEIESLSHDKSKIERELLVRKTTLKGLLEEVRELGLDPNGLEAYIEREKEVLKVKYATIESEIRDARRVIDPMLKEIGDA